MSPSSGTGTARRSDPSLESIREPVRERVAEIDGCIAEIVASDFGAVERVNAYLLSMRGKLLRPTLLLLSNEIGGSSSREAVRLGALVELVHLATLVHDDAVDHSVRRRGEPTINSRWSHQVAVIMGDYLYSRAVTEIARMGRIEAIEILAGAANRMAVGEMRQLVSHEALDFSEEDYDRLCACKTASLLAASCDLGQLFGSGEYREPLATFGFELGMAFQITDDLLDYTASSSTTGKPVGQDLREHRVTLPLIAALRAMGDAERRRVSELFDDAAPSSEHVEEVQELVSRRGGLTYARDRAAAHLEEARGQLAMLPESEARTALERSTVYVEKRSG